MPSAKSGKAGSPVKPTEPKKAYEADNADPGKASKMKSEQQKAKSGKYGEESETPYKSPQTEEEKQQKNSWIEIELVDEEDNPVPGEPFKVTLPDGTVFSGTLDEKGFAKIEGIKQGTCQITFTKLDKKAWEKA